jgi:hypothetical protein
LQFSNDDGFVEGRQFVDVEHAEQSTLDNAFDRGQAVPLLSSATRRPLADTSGEPGAKRASYRRRGEDDEDEGESDVEEEAPAAVGGGITQAEEDALLAEPEEGELPPTAAIPQR